LDPKVSAKTQHSKRDSWTGHGYVSDCDQTKALPDYGSARTFVQNLLYALHNQGTANDLKATPRTSLAKYCSAELLLEKHAYQASVNAYRDSLAGDGNPVWTKAWSYIQIGKIFDITGQRERSVAQYQLAIQTGDNTDGAINEARELLEHPFEWPANQ
jgi:hypothetical protein